MNYLVEEYSHVPQKKTRRNPHTHSEVFSTVDPNTRSPPRLTSDYSSASPANSGKHSRSSSLDKTTLPPYVLAGKANKAAGEVTVSNSQKMPRKPVSERRKGKRRGKRQSYRKKRRGRARTPEPITVPSQLSPPPERYGLKVFSSPEPEEVVNLYQEALAACGLPIPARLPVRREEPRRSSVIDIAEPEQSGPETGVIEVEGCFDSDVDSKEIMRELTSKDKLPTHKDLIPHAVISCATSPRTCKDAPAAQSLDYNARIRQLEEELANARNKSQEHEATNHRLKEDMGQLLKRSFHMLREARDLATTYKLQLEEMRGTITLSPGRSSINFETSRRQRDTAYPSVNLSVLNVADIPKMSLWTHPESPTGVHQLLDDKDVKIDRDSEDAPPPHPRRTIGPADPEFTQCKMFNAFAKYLFV